MDDWHTRKARRTERYKAMHGVKAETCTACNGSGHYDSKGSPACGCCGGTGKVRATIPSPAR